MRPASSRVRNKIGLTQSQQSQQSFLVPFPRFSQREA